ncbi:O-antigen ligase family protein [Falsiroseomonas tokyonensis]|uniref:O-antigen ligase family protein n=1 Tax=Falsiroseomonas tokyonensis TaxID=430521 RepID=A0ABV7BRD0_9PROT|nr:O-antigen ligase family protein [Falsiroseomonas tokyonensis]MBU8537208.1 O-antigen ligase domain-containing protein [Falsiroseomonas tokyonensis]
MTAAPAVPPTFGSFLLASLAGGLAAVLQLAGALKTAPALAGALPFDLTLASLVGLLPLLALLLATRRWVVAPELALPLAAAALLWLWLVVAGAWSPSRLVLAQKLPELALAGPFMLAAGLLVGAEPAARRALCRFTLGIGMLLAVVIGLGALRGWQAVAQDLDQARVHHQLAGLALATAAALAALAAVEARHWLLRLGWMLAVLGLAAAALLPGGRTALAALIAGVALTPALRLGWRGGLGWLLAVLLALAAFLTWLLLHPDWAEGLRTLERLTAEPAGLEARQTLWQAALHWAGQSAPWGLGTGGFTIAAGHGEWRGLYPHNHALEALAEGGLPGLLLWLGAFGGAALAMARLAPGLPPARLARIAALVLPVALTVMVSTDLGNRMAWFALGLALSLGLGARAPQARGNNHV